MNGWHSLSDFPLHRSGSPCRCGKPSVIEYPGRAYCPECAAIEVPHVVITPAPIQQDLFPNVDPRQETIQY